MDFSGIQFFKLEFWHWWAIALIFVVAEAMYPAGIFAGMAIATGIVGAVFLAYPELHWLVQLGLFGLLSLIFSGLWYLLVRKNRSAVKSTRTKAREYLGQEFTLTMAIQNGFSELEIDGICWELKGPTLKAGNKVQVIGTDGDILVVRPVQPK